MSEYFDVHTHIGLDTGFYLRGWWPYACTTRQLLDEMDQHGITRAVCFPFTFPSAFNPLAYADRKEIQLQPGRFPFDRENACLLNEIERIDSQHRLVPFAMFDPSRELEKQVGSIQKMVGRIGGLKAQTTILQSNIRLLLNESKTIMELASQHDLPVLLHTSVIETDTWAQASDCLDVAAAYPQVRFNLAHSLRFDEPCLRRAAGLKNVWVDCSAHLIHCELARKNSPVVAPIGRRVKADYENPSAVLATIESILPGRYLWGSDNPYMSWCDDRLCSIYSYGQEVAALTNLNPDIRRRMASSAPRDWLLGEGASR